MDILKQFDLESVNVILCCSNDARNCSKSSLARRCESSLSSQELTLSINRNRLKNSLCSDGVNQLVNVSKFSTKPILYTDLIQWNFNDLHCALQRHADAAWRECVQLLSHVLRQ